MFEKPTPTAKIWRYLSFTKFVAMLHYGTLRFRLASALEDKHEGTLPWPSLDESDLDIVRTYDDIQAVTAVNCWQVSEEESAAMWRVYTGQGEGLAIQSIYDRLIQAFDDSDRALKGEPVYVGVVKYIEEDGLMDLGYALCRHPRGTAWLKAHHYHLSLVKAKAATSDIPLEIHWHIERPSRPFTIDLEGLWERAVPARIAGVDSWMLSPEDLVLRLGLHACKHRLTDSLRPLCDIAATIRRYGHILDWEQLQTRACHWRITPYVYLPLCLARDLVGAAVPDPFLRALQPRGLRSAAGQLGNRSPLRESGRGGPFS